MRHHHQCPSCYELHACEDDCSICADLSSGVCTCWHSLRQHVVGWTK